MPLGWMADHKQLVWGAGEWRGKPLVVGAILIAMDYLHSLYSFAQAIYRMVSFPPVVTVENIWNEYRCL